MVPSTLLLAALLSFPAAISAKESNSSTTSFSCTPSIVTKTVTSIVTVTAVSPSSTSKLSSSSSQSTSSGISKSSTIKTTTSTKNEKTSTSSTSSKSSTTTSSTTKPSNVLIVTSSTSLKPSTTSSTSSTSSASQPKSTPSLSTSFIYDLDNQPIDAPIIKTTSGLSLNKTMYIVDMAQSTRAQIDNYHAKGKKVGCYFSAGTWEPYRTDAKSFLPECYCGPNVATDSTGTCIGKGSDNNLLGEWGEWWLDIKSDKCLKNIKDIQTNRIKSAVEKGCDSVDPDNVDAWTNKQNFGITKQDQVNYLLWLSTTARSLGLGIDLKNSGDLITDPDTGKSTPWTNSLISGFDFNVIESCHEYNECDKYDPFIKAGKPQIQIEYSNSIKKCPSLAKGQQLLVYSGTTVDSKKITLSCP